MKIYLDFDGTVVEHSYPRIGIYNAPAFEVIKKLQAAGHEIILNTYRANLSNGTLENAIDYLNRSQNDFAPILKHEQIKIDPTPWNWKLHKQTSIIYIDDICPGIPVIDGVRTYGVMVDWKALDREFEEHGVY